MFGLSFVLSKPNQDISLIHSVGALFSIYFAGAGACIALIKYQTMIYSSCSVNGIDLAVIVARIGLFGVIIGTLIAAACAVYYLRSNAQLKRQRQEKGRAVSTQMEDAAL